jgi:signal transduction histidine kinase/CheY-like chemotaxis protein
LVLAALFAERRQHEARLQNALRAGGVTAFDWLVGTDVSQHSDNATEVLGLGPTLTASAFLARVHPEDRQRFKACLRGASPDKPSYAVIFRYLRPNDHEVWLEEYGQVEFDPAGRIVRVKGLTRDITDRKRVEAELATARKAAELANRAKTAFLSAASHDLRQPLQNLNLLQSALKRHVQDGEARALITRIGRSLGVMKSILDSLLDVNRLDGGMLVASVSDFQINDIFDSVAADFIDLAKEKGLKWRLVRSRVAVRSDRRLLEVMVRNLLSNAVRYTERGKLLLGCRRTGDKVRIEVWDSGIGIKTEHVPHIFEEYYRADESARSDGYGLGLAIVKRLGTLLDHHIGVSSAPGKGSGFSIELPLAKAKADAVDQYTMTITGGGAPFQGTILLIEDDSFVREGLVSLLKSDGLDVVQAANANEALALVARKRIDPDFILSDFNLRGSMDGVECIKALRAILTSKIPAIILTGDIRSEQLETIAKHDVGVATKPVNGDELLQLISHIYAHS